MTDGDPHPEEVFDVDRIRRLIELMEKHELSEIDLRHETQRIRLRRGNGGSVAPALQTAAAMPAAPASPADPSPVVAQGKRVDDENVVLIKSPMVGTYYNCPNPESEPFVKVGDHVSPDTIVCIIEAMKVFNEIPAEVTGTVVAVLVENEEAVEFGKPLFKVDTSK